MVERIETLLDQARARMLPAPVRHPVSIVGGGGTLTTLWERKRRLEAAHEAMNELCATLLRLACMWTPGFGNPKSDNDLLTFQIYESAFNAGLWIPASKGIVKEMQTRYSRQTRERIEDTEDTEVRQALHRAQEFYEMEPKGEHVKELAICLLDHAFPTEVDRTIAELLDHDLEEILGAVYGGREQALAVPEPNVKVLVPQRTGFPKKTLAFALVLCFLAGLGEWAVLAPIILVGGLAFVINLLT